MKRVKPAYLSQPPGETVPAVSGSSGGIQKCKEQTSQPSITRAKSLGTPILGGGESAKSHEELRVLIPTQDQAPEWSHVSFLN